MPVCACISKPEQTMATTPSPRLSGKAGSGPRAVGPTIFVGKGHLQHAPARTGLVATSPWTYRLRRASTTTWSSRLSQVNCQNNLLRPRKLGAQPRRPGETPFPELSACASSSDARHSYAVLRGLTASSGGMVAAATTSLPERSEAGRNYDYRYVWIRDQCYCGHAMAAVGDTRLLGDAVRFVTNRLLEHGSRLAPAYTATGKQVPNQRNLGLPGYPGGFDRIGNWVNGQFQLDAFGEALLLLADASRLDLLDADGIQAGQLAVTAIGERWTEPDAGIWEIENRPWTHSRLTAAAGLRSYCAALPLGLQNAEWLVLADRIVADTAAHATHPAGYWQRSPDDLGLDAALLLPALRGAIPADDPRTVATVAAYTDTLTIDGYAYRFRHNDGPLAQAEGAFTLCGFLMALATHQQGDLLSAQGWWERTKASCGSPLLYSEEYDTDERQMRGTCRKRSFTPSCSRWRRRWVKEDRTYTRRSILRILCRQDLTSAAGIVTTRSWCQRPSEGRPHLDRALAAGGLSRGHHGLGGQLCTH